MITVTRDRNPPVEMPPGKCWRWTAAVKSKVGYTASLQGWLSGSKRQALMAARAAEGRLKQVHCRRVKWKNDTASWMDGGNDSGSFVINGRTHRPRPEKRP